jgi:hypothetical protein
VGLIAISWSNTLVNNRNFVALRAYGRECRPVDEVAIPACYWTYQQHMIIAVMHGKLPK